METLDEPDDEYDISELLEFEIDPLRDSRGETETEETKLCVSRELVEG